MTTTVQAQTPTPDAFPAQPADMVREMVIAAHGNVKRVRELVTAHPALSKAAIDWGFGDWEDCLGAASHVGNREIAELLISNGARPTLFSAVMLGQLDTVKAFLTAHPGAQRIPGPHSISMLAHAKAGGKTAEPVFHFLDSLGDAGAPTPAPLSAEDKAAVLGTYIFGARANETIEVSDGNYGLMFTRAGTTGRGLVHVGNREFHPAGSEAVRIRFDADGSVTVHDPGLILTARKTR